MKRLAAQLSILIVLLVAFWIASRPRYSCFMKSDGSVYCYRGDGSLFRLRADRFTVEAPELK